MIVGMDNGNQEFVDVEVHVLLFADWSRLKFIIDPKFSSLSFFLD